MLRVLVCAGFLSALFIANPLLAQAPGVRLTIAGDVSTELEELLHFELRESGFEIDALASLRLIVETNSAGSQLTLIHADGTTVELRLGDAPSEARWRELSISAAEFVRSNWRMKLESREAEDIRRGEKKAALEAARILQREQVEQEADEQKDPELSSESKETSSDEESILAFHSLMFFGVHSFGAFSDFMDVGLYAGGRLSILDDFFVDAALMVVFDNEKSYSLSQLGGRFAVGAFSAELPFHLRFYYGVYAQIADARVHGIDQPGREALGEVRFLLVDLGLTAGLLYRLSDVTQLELGISIGHVAAGATLYDEDGISMTAFEGLTFGFHAGINFGGEI